MENDNEEDASSPSTDSSKKGISLTADVDLLECIICFQPLCPPVFQCRHGHVACSSCCDKMRNKCPICRLSIKYSRCVALEKLIESIKVPCSNCKEKISYTDLRKHREITCIHAPCFCPISNCTFSGRIGQLSAHVDISHKDVVKHVSYVGYIYGTVRIKRNSPLCVLKVDGHKELFLLVNHGVSSVGNALSVACLCSQISEYTFVYELEHGSYGQEGYLTMKAPMTTYHKRWTGPSSYPQDLFLLVPQKLGEVGSINVSVTIEKKPVLSAA